MSSSSPSSCCSVPRHRDTLLLSTSAFLVAFYVLHLSGVALPAWVAATAQGVFDIINVMWWGMLIGVLAVGALGHIPQHVIVRIIGQPHRISSVARATLGGVVFDLCNHGVIMIAMQLYKRGASLGQTMAFLIATPWNSLSLAIVLAALVGWTWMLIFTALSALIAFISGIIFDSLENKGYLPKNPYAQDTTSDSHSALSPPPRQPPGQPPHEPIAWLGYAMRESAPVMRWLFLGIVLAALLRGTISDDQFATWFAPTLSGLMLTIAAATIIEVCSEGTTPIAADIMHRSHAPGNGFAFLMSGTSTDISEIVILKQTTTSWAISLMLPIVTLPQIILCAIILNQWS
ncbi:MAG: permease [Alphaproteobacteria bacterium GM202ARS2]|nr:permease [Alphaproteobacteria bacterium GM202ARS2]